MTIQILTLFAISFLSPYLSVEKTFLTTHSIDTFFYVHNSELNAVISNRADITTVGLIAEKSPFFATVSLGIPWYKIRNLTPYLDINGGIKIGNLFGYGGGFIIFSFSNDNGVNGYNSIYIGMRSIHRIKKFRMDFDFQVKRENISTRWGENIPYYNSVFTSQVGYELRNINPFLFLSIEKRSVSEDLSMKAGIGITLGGMPFAKCEARKFNFKSYPSVFIRKPNIYLYPPKPCSVNVVLKPNGRIHVTDPPYQDSWNVMAFPGGDIQNTPGYLYYEAEVSKLNVKEKGWSISSEELCSFFYDVLNRYGFNKKETNDFVSYWKDKFPPCSYYAIYPIINKEIDKVCPLEINPKPDKILRVWFVVVPTAHPISLQKPYISSFKRNGFLVTEWGVIIKTDDDN